MECVETLHDAWNCDDDLSVSALYRWHVALTDAHSGVVGGLVSCQVLLTVQLSAGGC